MDVNPRYYKSTTRRKTPFKAVRVRRSRGEGTRSLRKKMETRIVPYVSPYKPYPVGHQNVTVRRKNKRRPSLPLPIIPVVPSVSSTDTSLLSSPNISSSSIFSSPASPRRRKRNTGPWLAAVKRNRQGRKGSVAGSSKTISRALTRLALGLPIPLKTGTKLGRMVNSCRSNRGSFTVVSTCLPIGSMIRKSKSYPKGRQGTVPSVVARNVYMKRHKKKMGWSRLEKRAKRAFGKHVYLNI